MSRMNVGRIDLSEFSKDWFIVMSRLDGRSTRANIAYLVEAYVTANLSEYKEKLKYLASKQGMSEDECFNFLLTSTKSEPFADSGTEVD